MEDKEIVRLFLERDDRALSAAMEKYRGYLLKIAANILNSHEEAEECLNDALMKTWELIPPNSPELLSAFMGKLIRNIAINRRKMYLAEKRGSGEVTLVYEELSELISGNSDVEAETERAELISEINAFLKRQPQRTRDIFICRYWYCDSISEIAGQFLMTENNVSVNLARTRKKLLTHLQKRGYEI